MKTVTTFTIDELLDVLVNSPEVVKVAERLGYKNWKVRLTFDDEIVTGFELAEAIESDSTSETKDSSC
jgi:hypothetical protein